MSATIVPQAATPAHAPMPAPLFGRDEALSMLGGDEDLLGAVVAVAREELGKQLAALATAMAAADAPAARRHAHTLKGTAATLGATAVKEHAFAMEIATRDGRLDEAAVLMPRLETLVASLSQELADYAS